MFLAAHVIQMLHVPIWWDSILVNVYLVTKVMETIVQVNDCEVDVSII